MRWPSSKGPSKPSLGAWRILLLASGFSLLGLALMRHWGGRDFDVFYASAASLWRGENPYADAGSLNSNPPHMIALMAPLAMLSADAAYWAWTSLSSIALGVSIVLIRRDRKLVVTSAALGAFLACSGTFYQVAGGQVVWLLALPMTLAWLWGPCFRAGLLVGVCAGVKPFLLLFVPYFTWRRQWPSLLGLLVGAIGSVGLGILLLGSASYEAWAETLQHLNTAYHFGNGSLNGIVERISQPTALFLISKSTARVAWLLMSAAIGLVTAWTLRQTAGRDLDWALLILAALLISPLGSTYYLALALGPLWLTLPRVSWPRWSLGILGLFWWPLLMTSPDPPTTHFSLLFYNMNTMGMLTLWAVLVRHALRSAATGVRSVTTAPSPAAIATRLWHWCMAVKLIPELQRIGELDAALRTHRVSSNTRVPASGFQGVFRASSTQPAVLPADIHGHEPRLSSPLPSSPCRTR